MIETQRVETSNSKILNKGLDNLIESFSSSALDKLVADDRNYLFLALSEGIAAGYVLAYTFPSLNSSGKLAYLYDIEVLETQRKKGIGRQLIEKLLLTLKADGVTELWLGTAIDNVAGQALFYSTGAEKSGETFNDYTYIL